MTRAPAGAEGPIVLGIMGGLAGGKSTVARMLAARGAEVIDADRIGHQVLKQPLVKRALVDAFGADTLDEESNVSRGRLAERAFNAPADVETLNRIVHPPILAEIRRRIRELRARGDVPLIVLDAALLVETDLHGEDCDALLFVDTPERLRRQRAEHERGIGPEQFDKRGRAQLPPDAKRKLADYIVVNDGSLKELDRRIGELWPRLRRATQQTR